MPLMGTREAILRRVSEFVSRHGISERKFGELVANDHKLVSRLRSRSVTLDRIERAETFMERHAAALPDLAPAQAERA